MSVYIICFLCTFGIFQKQCETFHHYIQYGNIVKMESLLEEVDSKYKKLVLFSKDKVLLNEPESKHISLDQSSDQMT